MDTTYSTKAVSAQTYIEIQPEVFISQLICSEQDLRSKLILVLDIPSTVQNQFAWLPSGELHMTVSGNSGASSVSLETRFVKNKIPNFKQLLSLPIAYICNLLILKYFPTGLTKMLPKMMLK